MMIESLLALVAGLLGAYGMGYWRGRRRGRDEVIADLLRQPRQSVRDLL
jgi:hypothetical protein